MNPPVAPRIVVAATIAAIVASFIIGRVSAPEHIREVAAKSERHEVATAAEASRVAAVEVRTVDRWRTRIVTRPDGTRIETRDVVAASEKKEVKRETARRSESRTEIVTEFRSRESARAATTPRFVVSLGVGALIPPRALPSIVPGLPSRLMLTASVNVRVAGPVYAGVFATSTGVVGLGASVAF